MVFSTLPLNKKKKWLKQCCQLWGAVPCDRFSSANWDEFPVRFCLINKTTVTLIEAGTGDNQNDGTDRLAFTTNLNEWRERFGNVAPPQPENHHPGMHIQSPARPYSYNNNYLAGSLMFREAVLHVKYKEEQKNNHLIRASFTTCWTSGSVLLFVLSNVRKFDSCFWIVSRWHCQCFSVKFSFVWPL